MTYPVLALDIATNTGWSFGVPDAHPASGSIGFSKDRDRRFDQFDTWLSNMITKYEPAMLAIEQPNIVRKNDLKGPLSSCGMAAIAQLAAYRRELVFKMVPSKSAAKTFTGNGGGKSAEIKARNWNQCLERGWSCADFDESDALAVWVHATTVIVPTIEEVA